MPGPSLTREQVREMIVNEVASQLRPFDGKLSDIVGRLNSLYRNGDKSIAPGYLDLRKEVDDERWRKVDAKLESIDNRLNSEKEQTIRDDERGKVQKENEKDQKEESAIRRDWWKWGLGILGALFIAMVGWVLAIALSDHYHWHIVTGPIPAQTTLDGNSHSHDVDNNIK